MCDPAPFLDAVRSAPEEDAPRLVFADWLDENDQPEWAEFIRVGCLLARLPAADPRRPDLAEREDALIKAHRDGWLRPFRPTTWRLGCLFRRGFVDRLSLEPAVGHPPNGPDDLRTLIGRPVCAAVGALRIDVADLDRALPAVLAGLPALAALRRLEVQTPNVGDDGMEELSGSPYLGRLTGLRVVAAHPVWRTRPVHSAGVRALAASATITRLQELDLSHNAIGPEGASVLASALNFANLRCLRLTANQLGDEGARALAAAPRLRRLTDLDLGSNGIGNDGVEALTASPAVAGLRRLSLGSHPRLGANPFDDWGALALARSNYLENLDELYLGDPRPSIGPAGWKALRSRFGSRLKTDF